MMATKTMPNTTNTSSPQWLTLISASSVVWFICRIRLKIKGWVGRKRNESINCLDVELGADDADNFHRLTGGHDHAPFFARRCRVARAGLHVSDFAHAVGRDRRDDGRRLADQLRHVRLAGALQFPKSGFKQKENPGRNQQPAQYRQGRADPEAAGDRNA